MLSLFRKHRPSLSDVRIECPNVVDEGVRGGCRVYYTPEGDGCGVYFFNRPPALPDTDEKADFMSSYRNAVKQAGVELLDVHIVAAQGLPGLKQLARVMQSAGCTFLASLTLPFDEFSFVVKLQCEEKGATGFREALLLERGLQEGAVLDESGRVVGEWDPYDVQYDAMFPDHPASRARRWFPRLLDGLIVAKELSKHRSFFWWSVH